MKTILELSALILSIVNGLMLLRAFLRDRPRLTVKPIHPDVYQWYIDFSESKKSGDPARNFGFLAYIGITNRGLRDVCLVSWRLFVQSTEHKWIELRPSNIPEPEIPFGGMVKFLPVLGQKGERFQGETMVKSGSSISGCAYFMASIGRDCDWQPIIEGGTVTGRITVESAFGTKTSSMICFSKIPLEKASSIVEGIEEINLPK